MNKKWVAASSRIACLTRKPMPFTDMYPDIPSQSAEEVVNFHGLRLMSGSRQNRVNHYSLVLSLLRGMAIAGPLNHKE